MRVVIVGGGILGLGAGRLLARERPEVEIVLLEKETALAQHQTGRNSGVVHAGLYYEPGSLKARLCRRGGELLRAFCSEHALPFLECGKVLVATREEELPRLERVLERARANGVEATLIGPQELRGIEPHASGLGALHSPRTAIVDYPAVCGALASEMRERGARIMTGRPCGPSRGRRVAHGSGSTTARCSTQTASSSAPVCTPTASHVPPVSLPSPGSCRSEASTGSYVPTVRTSSTGSSIQFPIRRCRSSAST